MTKPKSKEAPKVTTEYKFPPIRTPQEWRRIMRDKLNQYERIGYEIMGGKGVRNYGE